MTRPRSMLRDLVRRAGERRVGASSARRVLRDRDSALFARLALALACRSAAEPQPIDARAIQLRTLHQLERSVDRATGRTRVEPPVAFGSLLVPVGDRDGDGVRELLVGHFDGAATVPGFRGHVLVLDGASGMTLRDSE